MFCPKREKCSYCCPKYHPHIESIYNRVHLAQHKRTCYQELQGMLTIRGLN